MLSEKPISHGMGDLKPRDEENARQFWHRYFDRPIRLARHKHSDARQAGLGHGKEDLALSVLNGIFRGVAVGKVPETRQSRRAPEVTGGY